MLGIKRFDVDLIDFQRRDSKSRKPKSYVILEKDKKMFEFLYPKSKYLDLTTIYIYTYIHTWMTGHARNLHGADLLHFENAPLGRQYP